LAIIIVAVLLLLFLFVAGRGGGRRERLVVAFSQLHSRRTRLRGEYEGLPTRALRLILLRRGSLTYFAVRTKEGWRAAGRKYGERWVIIIGNAAKIIAKAINAIYS